MNNKIYKSVPYNIQINNNKLIKLDKSYSFVFLEREDKINVEHPACNYYFKLNDLSINLLISLKWAEWAYYFLTETSKNLEMYKNLEIFEGNIENSLTLNDFRKHILILDNKKICSNEDFIREMEETYNEKFVDANTKTHFKLKINLKEYLILTNILQPELMKLK